MNAPAPIDREAEIAKARRARLVGIALISMAAAMFAGLDSIAKYLTLHMDQLQVAWARYASALVLCFVFSNPFTTPDILRTGRLGLHVARGLLLCASTVLGVIALRYIQLDEATAIVFSGPLIIAALSGPALGEWIGPRRWAAIGVGFLGVLLVTRPGFSGIHPAAILTVFSAICYAFYTIMTRILARTDSEESALFYSNFVGAFVLTPVLPFVWSTPADLKIVGLMVVIGGFAGYGHYLLIMALRRAPAAVLSPFTYSQLVWVMLIGFVVFEHVPSRWSLAGVAFIVGSGLYLIHRERVRKGHVDRLL